MPIVELINTVLGVAGTDNDLYESMVEAAQKKTAGAGVQALDEFKQAMADEYGLDKDYSNSDLSTAMTEKARNKAKESTGTLTAQNSQSSQLASQNAIQNAGINKSQAAMNAMNKASGEYDDLYDNTLEQQTNQMSSQLQDQYSAAKDWYTTQRAADIAWEGQQDLAAAEKYRESTSSITGNIGTIIKAIQDGDFLSVAKMLLGVDSIKWIADEVAGLIGGGVKKAASGIGDFVSGIGSKVSDFFSGW